MSPEHNSTPSHCPMTNPEAVLAIHPVRYGHSVSWVERDDGGILLLGAGGVFRTSHDAGLTWSDEVAGKDENGDDLVGAYGPVRLSGDGLGLVAAREGESGLGYDQELIFRRSDDEGRTWQRNRDGELLILRRPGGPFDYTCEPSVTEVTPGKLLMIMRTGLGRYFQAWSLDEGETWTRPQPTHLAGTHTPAQVRTLPNGHLLCVFTQHSEEEILQGFIRSRLSSTISRCGGKLWEHFQNVESIHPESHVAPGPITDIRPAGYYAMTETGGYENDAQHVVPLPVGWGRMSYPSVLVLKDRVLIAHTYSVCDEIGVRRGPTEDTNAKIKVLPMSWFYGGREPYENADLSKLDRAANP